MRRFTFLIGSTDDFESIEALEEAYNNVTLGERNASVYTIPLRADCGTDTMTVRDIATYIGRGLAFSNDWGMDGTVSTLLEV
jgi:hypothetical protein